MSRIHKDQVTSDDIRSAMRSGEQLLIVDDDDKVVIAVGTDKNAVMPPFDEEETAILRELGVYVDDV